jgi:hypothetical protein
VSDYNTLYNWPKPNNWPWEWPKYPNWIPPSDTQYLLCINSRCNYIVSCLLKHHPRIITTPGKGQGVVAINTTYQKGQILGEVIREFVPLDTFENSWAIEFIRPDLNNEPIAQIYTKEKGNWIRKVNHDCKSSAE